MTMLRPARLMSRLIDSVSIKTAAVALIGVTGWHFSDAGSIRALEHEDAQKQARLDFQREEIGKKEDRDAYEADRKELHDDLREIRLSEDQIKQLLMERAR
jgi:hypothetical protein